jgi:hypothetical protein
MILRSGLGEQIVVVWCSTIETGSECGRRGGFGSAIESDLDLRAITHKKASASSAPAARRAAGERALEGDWCGSA